MEIFIDTASVDDIEKWIEMGVIDGVTTNPSIMYSDGVYDAETGAKKIAALVYPRPVSVEVTTNDLNEMVAQAERFASWAPNIIIKVPQITQDGIPCYGVVNHLESEGIKVNATAALSLRYLSTTAHHIAAKNGKATILAVMYEA